MNIFGRAWNTIATAINALVFAIRGDEHGERTPPEPYEHMSREQMDSLAWGTPEDAAALPVAILFDPCFVCGRPVVEATAKAIAHCRVCLGPQLLAACESHREAACLGITYLHHDCTLRRVQGGTA